MPETNAHQDSFNHKTKLLNIALKYTNGDIQRAKFMIGGQYNDVKIIKGKFEIDDSKINCIFIIFINIPNKYIMNINCIIVQNDNIISKASIFDSWKAFNADLADCQKKKGESALPSSNFLQLVINIFEKQDIYTEIEGDNLENLTRIITDIIKKAYSVSRVNCKLNIDNSNSLTLELSNIPIEEPKNTKDKEALDELDEKQAEKIAEIESKAEYVLNGRIIISPIKGKPISEIKTGDKIKILLSGKDDFIIQIAKSLSALSDDNEILPVNMRITEKFPMGKKGYYIYGLIAKNVLVKIIEEEDVKIETDSVQKITKSDKDEKSKSDKTMLYIVLLTGLLLLILIIIIILI